MADRLGQTVQYVQRTTSSKEFVRWKYYIKESPNFFDPIYYYLANIVWTLLRVNSKDGKLDISLEDCLIKFGMDKESLSPEQRIKQSKDNWAAFLGISHHDKTKNNGAITKTQKDSKKSILQSKQKSMRK